MGRDQQNWLSTLEVIEEIEKAMEQKKPLSVVRVGDGENLCLAQYKVWPIRKVLATRWARLSRSTNWKGVRLPNIELRDSLIKSIKKADIVGIPYRNDKEILAEQHQYLRPLTDACFGRFDIEPAKLCHTFINRHMVEYLQFWEMLRGKRVVVISRWANQFKRLVGKKYGDFDIEIVKTIRIDRYEEIPAVVQKMKSVECDIVFISAGVNAVILAQKLAEKQGRVAVDFGKSAIFMIKGNPKVRAWSPKRDGGKRIPEKPSVEAEAQISAERSDETEDPGTVPPSSD
ncbi:GT-D fold domain-containing glycosyltransferase [Paenibacillus allorhizosphaerae]|uniref:GT-D fold-like domain-containing protein n=1 Tax=Paenibacillus allorhizosphaerae TaxID=2849866 RepID=A0ABM8VKX7_9BACL|nr:GT-D fold domain-containing glycosyltransferase [Paenibacillus allorhizosphaerae]CAG7647772.1 hypothetical protein PAECIP111802_04060 [Paenibacillus allorhizosphaerae]